MEVLARCVASAAVHSAPVTLNGNSNTQFEFNRNNLSRFLEHEMHTAVCNPVSVMA
jgi:hypothetical protein